MTYIANCRWQTKFRWYPYCRCFYIPQSRAHTIFDDASLKSCNTTDPSSEKILWCGPLLVHNLIRVGQCPACRYLLQAQQTHPLIPSLSSILCCTRGLRCFIYTDWHHFVDPNRWGLELLGKYAILQSVYEHSNPNHPGNDVDPATNVVLSV